MRTSEIIGDIRAQFCYIFSKENIISMLETIADDEELKDLYCQIMCSCVCSSGPVRTTTTSTTSTSTTSTTAAPAPCGGSEEAFLTITIPLTSVISSVTVTIEDTLMGNAVVYNNTFTTFPINIVQPGLFTPSPATNRYRVLLSLITVAGNTTPVTATVDTCSGVGGFTATNRGSLVSVDTGTFKTDIFVIISV